MATSAARSSRAGRGAAPTSGARGTPRDGGRRAASKAWSAGEGRALPSAWKRTCAASPPCHHGSIQAQSGPHRVPALPPDHANCSALLLREPRARRRVARSIAPCFRPSPGASCAGGRPCTRGARSGRRFRACRTSAAPSTAQAVRAAQQGRVGDEEAAYRRSGAPFAHLPDVHAFEDEHRRAPATSPGACSARPAPDVDRVAPTATRRSTMAARGALPASISRGRASPPPPSRCRGRVRRGTRKLVPLGRVAQHEDEAQRRQAQHLPLRSARARRAPGVPRAGLRRVGHSRSTARRAQPLAAGGPTWPAAWRFRR